ncbi:uncharacterized protein [Apostichopus japonicus]|uniref:uncharacterized protein n=1 Tax=Stichopus japonicus TaxID=307972 RepID=UPI003AB5D093
MDSGLSVELQTLAKQLLENGSVPLKEFSKFIVQQLWDVIYPDNKRPITSSDRGRMWNRFHNLRLDPQVLKVWKELLSRINLLTIALSSAQLFMLQHILEFLMKLIIAEQQKYDMPMKDDIDTVFPISQHEEQIIRYVAGYIPFALKRRLLRQKNLDNSVLDFVKSLSVESASAEGTSFYNYTKQWINKQNRGGLFVVNNLTYLFFKTLEFHTKKVLNVKRLMVLKDVNIKSELLNVLNTHNQVQKRWDELVTTELDVKVKQDLLKLFVGYWVKLRVNAFVRMYMEVRKRNNKKAGKKGEKALRKTLANQDK